MVIALLALTGAAEGSGPLSGPVDDEFQASCDLMTINSAGFARSYYLCVPAGLPVPAPLVMGFHGSTGSADMFARQTLWHELGTTKKFMTAYLNGCDEIDCNGGSFDAKRPDQRDFIFVSDVINAIKARYPVDPRRTYAVGHSGGGSFSGFLACDMADIFAAIGTTASRVPTKNCAPTESVSIFHFHGTADTLIPFEGSETMEPVSAGLEFWSDQNGCSNAKRVFSDDGTTQGQRYNGCDSRRAVHWWMVEGAGHDYGEFNATLNVRNTFWARFSRYYK